MIDERQSDRAIAAFTAALRAVDDEDFRLAVAHVDDFAEYAFPWSDDRDSLWSSAARLRLVSLACLVVIDVPSSSRPYEAIGSLIGLRAGRVDVVGLCVEMLRASHSDVRPLCDRMLAADDAFQSVCVSQKARDSVDALIDDRLAFLQSAARSGTKGR
jgi:hypothetical protein